MDWGKPRSHGIAVLFDGTFCRLDCTLDHTAESSGRFDNQVVQLLRPRLELLI